MSGGPDRTFYKPVKVRHRLQWRPQGVGDARTMGSAPRSVVGMDWSQPSRESTGWEQEGCRGETPQAFGSTTDA